MATAALMIILIVPQTELVYHQIRLQNHLKVDYASALMLSSLSFFWISFATSIDGQELAFEFSLILRQMLLLGLL